MMKQCPLFFVLLLLSFVIGACADDKGVMHDGYYSARAATPNADGWKAFITLYVHNDRIITAEYNERNASGLIMSWDVLYLSRLKAEIGAHPNQIIREYTNEFLNRQNPEGIRRARGETRFCDTFKALASAAVAQAKAGDKTVAEIPSPGIAAETR